MFRSPVFRLLSTCTLAVATTGCVLLFENGSFQTLSLHFTIDEEIAADEVFEVERLVHPNPITWRRNFAQLSGMLMAPDGEEVPGRVQIIVLAEDESGRRVDRIRKNVNIDANGGFKTSQRLRRDIPAGATQVVTIEPDGLPIPAGTTLWLCLDIVERRRDLRDLVDCSVTEAADPSEVAMVQVVDNRFEPQNIVVEPGQTVRWVFNGLDPSHSVTSVDPSLFDSGFIFNTPGDFFEVTFGQDSAGQSIDYFCRSHVGMVGTVDVTG